MKLAGELTCLGIDILAMKQREPSEGCLGFLVALCIQCRCNYQQSRISRWQGLRDKQRMMVPVTSSTKLIVELDWDWHVKLSNKDGRLAFRDANF
jgi:hypothetical protein